MRYLNAHGLVTNLPVVENYFARRAAPRSGMRIFFQDEHNLVLPGGLDFPPSSEAGVETCNKGVDERCLVSIDNE
jgi:hypothetical protein